MKPSLTIVQVRAFCALAQHRSFKAAAQALGTSQPSVISHIGALEEACGAKLFQRQRENNRLTDLGVALLPSFRAVLGHLKDAELILLSHSTSQSGELNVAAVNPARVSSVLRELRVIYPNIKVNVIFAASDRVQGLLDSDAVDMAFFVQPRAQPGQQAIHYYQYELMAILPRHHPLAAKDALTVMDFAGNELVIREEGSLTRRLFLDALANAGVPARVAYELGSRESVREAVAQGLGVSVVAEDEHVPHEGIVTRRIMSEDMKASSSLVVSNKRLGSSLIKTAIELVRHQAQLERPAV